MNLRELFKENINRTGESKSAVVGWGRGMGHRGHMYLADAVITEAEETSADPYFVVSRTMGKDDPITPEEKLHLYKRVYPKMAHIFHAASDELPDLNRVLKHLASLGYTDVTVVVGADQKNAFQYLVRPDKSGVPPYQQFGFSNMRVISRQETNSKYSQEEGPRATPMRDILTDPKATDEQKFQAWRDAMNPEISDDEVRTLMHKATTRMQDFNKPKVRAKKEKAVGESHLGHVLPWPEVVNKVNGAMKAMGWKGQRKDEGAFMFNTKGQLDDEHYFVIIENEGGGMFRYALGTVEEGDPYIGEQEILPTTEASISELMDAIREGFGLNERISVREANRMVRSLREGSAKKVGKGGTKAIDKEQKAAMKNAATLPGLNMATGSMYMNYRMGIALAGAPTFPTKIEADNWIGGDPLISSYTQEEFEMVKAAAKQVGAGKIQNWTGNRSLETADVNKTSAVSKPKKNQYGV